MKLPDPGAPLADRLSRITLRQLRHFHLVCQHGDFFKAAVTCGESAEALARSCDELGKILGDPLLESSPHGPLPTVRGRAHLPRISAVHASLRRLKRTVDRLHGERRVVRLGAADAFFRSQMFLDAIRKLDLPGIFRPLFVKLEAGNSAQALGSGACDVYFGAGLAPNQRTTLTDLGNTGWRFTNRDGEDLPAPPLPDSLPARRWWLDAPEDADVATRMLEELHGAGACGGRLLGRNTAAPRRGDWILSCDSRAIGTSDWPSFRFGALVRKNHPYAELVNKLSLLAPACRGN